MAKRISDALMGALGGGGAGAGALGGLGAAGIIGKAGMAASPWAWGLLAGGAGLGAVSSLLGEDDPQEELAKEQLKQARQLNKRRAGTASNLGAMFSGAGMASRRIA